MIKESLSRRQILQRAGIAGAAGIAALVPVTAFADGDATNPSASLIGAWLIMFSISGGPTFRVLEVFTAGGEVVGASNNPPSSASPAFGAWKQAENGDDAYLNTHEFFSFDSSGNFTGTTRVRALVTVAADQMSGSAKIDFQPNGSPSFIAGVGSATLSGTRITTLPAA